MVEPIEKIVPNFADTTQMIDTKTDQLAPELKRKTRELAYLDKLNILNED